MSTVVVTGAGGFVGRHVLRALSSSTTDEIVGTIRPGSAHPDLGVLSDRIHIDECDLTDPDAATLLITRWRPASIIDLAVDRSTDNATAGHLNVVGFSALLDAAEDLNCYVAHAGSSLEYGVHHVPITSTSPCDPDTALGITKLQAHHDLAGRVGAGSLRGMTLRFFHVYGPGEPKRRLVPCAFRAAITGEPLPLTDISAAHDLIYVGDVVDALLAAVSTQRSQPPAINVCTGTSSTNHDVVKMIEEVTDARIDREVGAFPARDWDRSVWTADPVDVVELLGRAPLSLATGLRLTLEHQQAVTPS